MTLWADAAWQSTAVAVAALALTRIARRAPAAIRQAILAVALLKFLTPPLAIFPGSVFALLPNAAPSEATAIAVDGAAPGSAAWGLLLLAAYLAGALIVSAVVAVSMVRVARLRRGARTASGTTLRLAASLAERIGLRRAVSIVVSDAFAAPMAVGVLRPAVLVPGTLEASLDAGELRAIIAHELAHHRRRDLL